MLVDFYHLERTPLERVLPSICEKVLASGERLLIVAEAGELARLDEQLWTYSAAAFLPHGRSDAPHPERQPVLLSAAPTPLNEAGNIALGDGQWREEALTFSRAFYFFGSAQLDSARTAWRALKTKAEVEARYWKRDDRGKWVQGP